MSKSGESRKPGLIFVTQVLDPDNPVLGFVTGWVSALSNHFELWVLANEVRARPPSAGTVISLGKESGFGKTRRTARYLQALRDLLKQSPAALFAHMCPVYLNLASPLCLPKNIPTVLWYAHPAVTAGLRLAERLCSGVLTSFEGSFPLHTRKLRCIGQGIPVDRFEDLAPPSPKRPFRILAAGRTSPAKGYPTLIKAMTSLAAEPIDIALRICGPSTTPEEIRHRTDLEAMVADYGLSRLVSIEGPVPYPEIPNLYAAADIVVNTMVSGSGDKTALEAMASARPVIASNPVFKPLLSNLPLSLDFSEGDHEALAARMREAAGAGSWLIQETGLELRRRVKDSHSIDHWSGQVAQTVNRLASRPSRPSR